MDERYIRNLGALSEEEMTQLRSRRVLVAGCGGLGGYIIQLLLRLGVGSITAVDGDCFENSNLNRQLFSDLSVIGRYKAEVVKEKAALINPDVELIAVKEFITDNNASDLVSGCDIVFDALDNVPARLMLAAVCEKAGVPFVHGAIDGWAYQVCLSLPGDGAMKKLYEGISGEGRSPSSLSFVPAFCASMQCALGVQCLLGHETPAGVLKIGDLSDLSVMSVKL